MTYTRIVSPRRVLPRVLGLLSVAGALSGGGMLAIFLAVSGAVLGVGIPLVSIPFGMVSVGVGLAVSYYAARVALTRSITHRYEGTHHAV